MDTQLMAKKNTRDILHMSVQFDKGKVYFSPFRKFCYSFFV